MRKEEFFILSSETIFELESIKTDKNKSDNLKYSARKAVRFLDEHPDKYEVVMCQNVLENPNANLTPDEKIILCAVWASQHRDIVFISDDLLARLIAKHNYNLEVGCLSQDEDEIYKGYKLLKGSSEDINNYMSQVELTQWNTNEYLIIENTDDGSAKEMRFDGEKFVALRLPPSKYVKAKNSLQRCALDLLYNPDITIATILGGYGSGKTFLCMQMALYHTVEKGNFSKIVGIREPHGEGREVGFLPGSFNNKTDLFFQPLAQQLHGGEFELERLKQQGVLESNIPYYMKGTTYNDSILIVDEAEDLTAKQIRLIGTRLGNNSKIYLSGDFKQSVINPSTSNALIEMCNSFRGHKNFACIYLEEDVRSETSRMFADLYK